MRASIALLKELDRFDVVGIYKHCAPNGAERMSWTPQVRRFAVALQQMPVEINQSIGLYSLPTNQPDVR